MEELSTVVFLISAAVAGVSQSAKAALAFAVGLDESTSAFH